MSDLILKQGEVSKAENYGGLTVLGDPEGLRKKLQAQNDLISVIHDFIQQNFERGVDYGVTDDRSAKLSLMKPGAEKVCRLLNCSPRWECDNETFEMLGKPKDVVCYKCKIVDNATGRVVGEGRGADKIGNKSRDANKAIKNAEKCALVDAALYTFMLSDRFTQDGGGVSAIGELKRQLIEDITDLRAGEVSDLSDVQWLQEVLKNELHKSSITTIKELTHMRKVIFELETYDLKTGKKKETENVSRNKKD